MRRAVLWSFAALSLGSTLILALVCQGPPPVRVGSDWTAERLAKEIGEGWESRPCPDGVLLRRPTAAASWEDLQEIAGSHFLLARHRDVLLVCHPTAIDNPGLSKRPADGTLRLGRLAVHGHPDELQRLAKQFTSD